MPFHLIMYIFHCLIRTGRDLSLRKIKSLSQLIGDNKTITSNQLHSAGFPEFEWHRSIHDYIIRTF